MTSRLRACSLAFTLPLALFLSGCPSPAPHPEVSRPVASPAAWDTTFRDVASEVGIDFVQSHRGKTPLTILETTPGGAAFLDLEGDGWLDLILVGTPRCAVYRNDGKGRFTDVTKRMGLAREGPWVGCSVGDYDNDGDPDLFLTGYRQCALLRNDGGRRFVDVTSATGVTSTLWTTSAAFADVDGDGWLDLYVGAYVDYRIGTRDHCLVANVPSVCGPEVYGPERGRLYRNVKGTRFEDITAAAGLAKAAGKTWGVAFADYDDDGRPDLYLANDQVPGNLFRNRGGAKFEEVGTASGTAYSAGGTVQGGMGVDWGDANGDGRLDLFVTTYAHQVKELYLNEGQSFFRPVAVEAGLSVPTLPYVAFGCGFMDANNNGHLDLFIANGHVRENVAGFDPSQRYAQPLQFFANTGDGTFQDVSHRVGASLTVPLVGRGAAFGDYDNDGLLDVVIVDLEGQARLLRNAGGPHCGSWILVRLDGGQSNREGIGARITLQASGQRQTREVSRGRSVLSASDYRAHFGLGTASSIDQIRVRWPDGHQEAWRNVPVNRILNLRKGSGHSVQATAERGKGSQ